MLTILLMTIMLGLLSAALFGVSIAHHDSEITYWMTIVPGIALAAITLALPIAAIDSARKASYYNTMLHTNYTALQFLLNGDEIERVEIPRSIRVLPKVLQN